MRFGTVHSFQDPPKSPIGHSRVYDAAVEQVVRSEQLGFDWVNVTEHHVSDDGYGPALLPTLAALAMVTHRLRLSTGMLILPLHQPVRIAEEAAVVDILSHGRLTLGVAAGYRELEFGALGVPYRRRGQRLEESLDVLVRAWSGDEFSFVGETIQIAEPIVVRPLPVQLPHPPLWIGGSSPRALRLAARFDAPLCPGATERSSDVVDALSRYDDVRAAAGLDPCDSIVLPRLALVAETTKVARRLFKPVVQQVFGRYRSWGGPSHLDDALTNQDLLDDLTLVGDEETVRAGVERLAELGVTDLMLQFAVPTLQPGVQEESLERFAAVIGAAV